MKLVILIVGLVLVRSPSSGPVMIFMPDAPEMVTRIAGHEDLVAPRHRASFGYVSSECGGTVPSCWKTVSLSSRMQVFGNGTPNTKGFDQMLEANGFLEESPAVRTDCLTERDFCSEAVARLTIGTGTLTAGQGHRQGRFTSESPRTLRFTRQVSRLFFAPVGFPRLRHRTTHDHYRRQGTSGILFETTLSQPEINFLGKNLKLAQTQHCGRQSSAPCYFIRIHNIPGNYWLPDSSRRPIGHIDTHFGHLYKLFSSPPSPYRLPYLLSRAELNSKRIDDVPSSRCPSLLVKR